MSSEGLIRDSELQFPISNFPFSFQKKSRFRESGFFFMHKAKNFNPRTVKTRMLQIQVKAGCNLASLCNIAILGSFVLQE